MILFRLSFFVYPRSLCVRETRASPSFLNILIQDPSGLAPFLRIRAEFRDNVIALIHVYV